MLLEDFYTLTYEDLVDKLLEIRTVYKFGGLSKARILEIAKRFSNGFRPRTNLKAYLTFENNLGLKEADEESAELYRRLYASMSPSQREDYKIEKKLYEDEVNRRLKNGN